MHPHNFCGGAKLPPRDPGPGLIELAELELGSKSSIIRPKKENFLFGNPWNRDKRSQRDLDLSPKGEVIPMEISVRKFPKFFLGRVEYPFTENHGNF